MAEIQEVMDHLSEVATEGDVALLMDHARHEGTRQRDFPAYVAAYYHIGIDAADLLIRRPRVQELFEQIDADRPRWDNIMRGRRKRKKQSS